MTDRLIESGAVNIDKVVPKSKEIQKIDFDSFEVSRVDKKNDPDTWLRVGQLRAEVYRSHGFIGDEEIDELGAESDHYDDQSEHFIAQTDDGEIIGTIRVVGRKDGSRLPAEDIFGIELPDNATEISRFLVNPRIDRAASPVVSMSLIRSAMHATEATGGNTYAVIEDGLHRYLNGVVGIHARSVTEPVFVESYNTKNQVVEIEPHNLIEQVRDMDKMNRRPRGIPSELAPFFEQNAATKGLGRVALASIFNGSRDA